MFNFLKKYFFVALFFLAPLQMRAAELYFSPGTEKVGPGDSFYVDIRIDVSECVNTISAGVKFPKELLSLADFFVGESILSLWVEKPESSDFAGINSSGSFNFSGGIPGGYCGKIAGDPGISNVVGRLVFRAAENFPDFQEGDFASISYTEDIQIFLNDGFGTLDKVESRDLNLSLASSSLSQIDQRQNAIDADNTPPEPFVVELYSTPSVYNGQKYIVFSTVDKQTGVDYYQVMEISPEENAGIKSKRTWLDIVLRKKYPAAIWTEARTPYLIKDQSLASIIKVKAVDKAGNERTVDYVPARSAIVEKQNSIISHKSFFAAFLLVLLVFFVIFLKIKKKKNQDN